MPELVACEAEQVRSNDTVEEMQEGSEFKAEVPEFKTPVPKLRCPGLPAVTSESPLLQMLEEQHHEAFRRVNEFIEAVEDSAWHRACFHQALDVIINSPAQTGRATIKTEGSAGDVSERGHREHRDA